MLKQLLKLVVLHMEVSMHMVDVEADTKNENKGREKSKKWYI